MDKEWYLLEDTEWLLKIPRPNTGEHWAEKIAAEVGKVIGVNTADVELARSGNQLATICHSFLPNLADTPDPDRPLLEVRHGRDLLGSVIDSYDFKGALMKVGRPDRRPATQAPLALAVAFLTCALAMMTPVTALGQGPSVQEDSPETLTELIQRLSTEGMDELRYLTTNYSPRRSYTEEELAAGDYIKVRLNDLAGYTVTVQLFRKMGDESEVSTLSLPAPPASNKAATSTSKPPG